MELLRVTTNKPWKAKSKNVEFLQDLCCLDFDNNLNWTLYLNGTIKSGFGYKPLKSIFSEIVKKKECRRKNHDNERRLVIWTTRVNLVAVYLQFLGKDLEVEEFKKFRNGKYENIKATVYNKDLEFRNFDLICGESINDLKITYQWENESNIAAMVNFIKMRQEQGLKTWTQLRFSLGNGDLKLFYKDFTEMSSARMRYESICRSISLPLFQLYQHAPKNGVIACNENYLREWIYGVRGFDINEAYGSQFVRCNDFPISRPYKVEAKELSRLIKEDKWFFLVMKSDIKMKIIGLEPYEFEDSYYYFIEQYDYKCMEQFGKKLSSYKEQLNWRIYAVYTCDEVGYLDWALRKKIVKLYGKRKYLKKKKDPAEKMIKEQLKILYGKGLALKESIDSNDDVKKESFWLTSYINAPLSYHALARNRYEIIRMMKKLNFEYIAVDTDGIKTNCRHSRRIFAERNKEIREENAAAGFINTKIGLWKYEGYYPNFIQFGKKVYAYEHCGEIVCKFAGCREKAWKEFFKNKKPIEAFLYLDSENPVIPKGIIKPYLTMENGQFKVEKVVMSYGINGIDKEESE